MYIVLIIVVVLLMIGGLPHWGYWGGTGSPYGYFPAGGLGVILLILIILMVMGRI